MNKRSVLSIIALALLAGKALAGSMGKVLETQDWRWMGSFSGGAVWAQPAKTQTFFLTPDIEKTFVAHKERKSMAAGELFVGIQKLLTDSLEGQFGLTAAAAGNAKLQGNIWDDADPLFNNYTYRYKINHRHIGVRAKFLLDKQFWLIPWISGSAGVGLNTAERFKNTPLIFEARTDSNFRSHTQTAFSYTLDAGLQRVLNNNWQIGLGYEFADWGKSELNRAAGQSLNSGLKLQHLYTQGVLVNLTYLA